MLDKWMALNGRHTRLEALVDEDRLDKTLPNIPCFQFQVVSTYQTQENALESYISELEAFLRT